MRGLIESSARSLNQAMMVRFVEHAGTLHSTDLGRTASHYYINTASIEVHVHDLYVHTHLDVHMYMYMYIVYICLSTSSIFLRNL